MTFVHPRLGVAALRESWDPTIIPAPTDPPKATITIPDDPEVMALLLCRDHLDCRDHIGGHDAYIWQAKRLLADLRRLT